MSHGRLQLRPQRAPAASLSDARPAVARDPYRIGPLTPATAAEWHERGVREECDGDLTAAITSYHFALLIGGANAQITFDLAYALAASGEVGGAIERYRQVIEIDATRADAWANLGDLLLTAGQTDAGIDALRRALQSNPDDTAAQYNLADALDAIDADEAAHYWQAFLQSASSADEHRRYAAHRLAACRARCRRVTAPA